MRLRIAGNVALGIADSARRMRRIKAAVRLDSF